VRYFVLQQIREGRGRERKGGEGRRREGKGGGILEWPPFPCIEDITTNAKIPILIKLYLFEFLE